MIYNVSTLSNKLCIFFSSIEALTADVFKRKRVIREKVDRQGKESKDLCYLPASFKLTNIFKVFKGKPNMHPSYNDDYSQTNTTEP